MTAANVKALFEAAPEFDPWGDPDIGAARQNRRAPPPLPLETFGPALAEWIGAAAEGAGCPVDYVAGPLLASAAALIGNSRTVSPWEGWKEPSILWIGISGDPSSNKSPGADPVLDVARRLEADLAADFDATHREWMTTRESARCAKEAWVKEVQDAVKIGTPAPIMPPNAVEPVEPVRGRIIASDATPEKLGELLAAHERGIMYYRDELAGWFGGFGRYSGGSGGDRAFWLEAYGGRPYVIDRVKHSNPITIPRLSVSVLGGVQPDRLADLLDGPDDGLQARFLWFWPEKVPPRRPTRRADPEVLHDAFRRLGELPLVTDDDGKTHPYLCPLEEDAADLFDQWRQDHAKAEVSGALASAYGKAPGHVLRLALVLAHLWWATDPAPNLPPSRIDRKAVIAAIALMEEYFKPMAERVFGDAALPEGDRLAAVLARWILKERPDVVNARDIRRKVRLPGLKEAEKVKLALSVLVEADWLKPDPKRAADNAGRQKEDYAVNPKVWKVAHG